jgi:hypothetical protein
MDTTIHNRRRGSYCDYHGAFVCIVVICGKHLTQKALKMPPAFSSPLIDKAPLCIYDLTRMKPSRSQLGYKERNHVADIKSMNGLFDSESD